LPLISAMTSRRDFVLGSLALECWKQRIPIRAEIKPTEWGPDLVKLERADLPSEPELLTADDIPF